ncbi:hypothetical protein SAMN05421544_11530 [Riemerella columbipharyngis]|uniref:Uncharacterized protein n=2 Tax=Riemerella columbipharyngis TaxID=1071918 RepID=A0A1G7EDB4_9FLAO|nr:hypothetical protein SAMN05421544_11530 [Riemerella columbipharyngis]
MPIFNLMEDFHSKKVVEDLKSYWGVKVENVSGDDQTITMEIDKRIVCLSFIKLFQKMT